MADIVNDETAIELGERREEERANGETQYVETDSQGDDCGVCNVEFGGQFVCTRCVHGGGEVSRAITSQ
jgi:hypothetical protein